MPTPTSEGRPARPRARAAPRLRGWWAPGSGAGPWERRLDGVAMALLGLLSVALLWPHRSRYLNGWDAVLFALATEDYDIGALRPHAPGYPIYVAAGKTLFPLTGDANAALVSVSLAFAALSVALLYGFLRELAPPRTALAGAGLYLLAPVLVFNGVVALSYTAEAAASVGLAWLCWRMRRSPRPALAAAIGATLALGAGLRASLVLFITPLAVFACLPRPFEWRALWRRGIAGAAGAAGAGVAWFLPMVYATGGLAAWRDTTALQSDWVVFSESVFARGWPALADHSQRLAFYFQAEVILLGLLLGLALLAILAGRGRRASNPLLEIPPGMPSFFIAWLLPSLLFYLLVFSGWEKGPTGYALVLLPGVYALFALLAGALLRRSAGAARHPGASRAVAWLAFPLLLSPAPSLVSAWGPFLEGEVRANDAWVEGWLSVKSHYPPNETAILSWYSWAYAKWYFPEYLMWSYLPTPSQNGADDWILTLETRHRRDDVPFYEALQRGPNQTRHVVPEWVRTIVIFDFQLAGENGATRRLAEDLPVEEAYAGTSRLLLLHPDPSLPDIESYFRYFPNARTLDL